MARFTTFTHLARSLALASLCAALLSCGATVTELSPSQQLTQLGKPPKSTAPSLHSASAQLQLAKRAHKRSPSTALQHYLSAIKLLESDRTRSSWQSEAYQLALGNAIELAQQHQLWDQISGSESLRISLSKSSERTFDSLSYSAKFQCRGLEPPIVQQGKGVALLAQYSWKEERNQDKPFLPKVGYSYAVTASSNWMSKTHLQISLSPSFHAPPHSSYDFTTPQCLVYKQNKKLQREGVIGVFRPNQHASRIGLFTHEPLDPDRIPVILVHGLASNPSLWIGPKHDIIQDSRLREHYQFYAYYYPTGLPIAYNAAQLKGKISQLHSQLKRAGAGRNADQMVIIGHSMGGVISSILTRDFTGTADQLFKKDPELLEMNEESREALLTLFEEPPLKCLKRAIFIAAPHRGSKSANKWYGRLTSHLIEIPKSVVRPSSGDYQNYLTDLGKTLVPSKDELDGVKRLKYQNPALMLTLSRPKVPWVSYHSIIGNRGRKGDITKSSDGVVAYSSSHLENVVSEKIVPSGHSAQKHRESIKEIQRILLLHLN